MSIRSSTTSVTKIDTGYLVETNKGTYESEIKSAFVTWDEAVEFIRNNPPKMYENKYNKDTESYESFEVK